MNNSYCDHFSFATLKLLLCSAITTAEWARFYKLLYSTFRCQHLFPSDVSHHLSSSNSNVTTEEENVSLHVITLPKEPFVLTDRYSSFSCLSHVTAWMIRFIHNCQAAIKKGMFEQPVCLQQSFVKQRSTGTLPFKLNTSQKRSLTF